MNLQEIKDLAEMNRKQAKLMLYSVVGLPRGFTSEGVDQVVDCIIGAAILEITAIQKEAILNQANVGQNGGLLKS